MFVVRKTLCEALARGMRVGPGPVCAGSRIVAIKNCKEKESQETRICFTPVRNYARERKKEIPSQLDDLPPTMLKKDYAGIPLTESVDDVIKRLLSLEMACHAEKLKVKTKQLVEKVKRSPDDDSSPEVKIALMTARIRNFQEHIQKHPKDKANKRRMLMLMDQRKKMLKNLRFTRYEAFEKVCTELGIEYTFPPQYYRRATRRWLAKKALCLKVYQEAKRLQALGLLKKKKAQVKFQEKPGTPV
ncbi:small ribosomal subunit protein uS15m [Pelodytes ibericus]